MLIATKTDCWRDKKSTQQVELNIAQLKWFINRENKAHSDFESWGVEYKTVFYEDLCDSFDETIKLIYSKGHRNPQGLFVEGDLILSTEHGPRGGDEINKIEFNKNYGWPIASYGQKYKKTNEKNPYMMSHIEQGFEEPIYVFIPSIGISEIIKIPNDFLDSWKDNFIVTSLYKRSIYRIKFDDKYNKLLFAEEIFIGQRVRDVKYHNKKIFLALESQGDLGILNKANKN